MRLASTNRLDLLTAALVASGALISGCGGGSSTTVTTVPPPEVTPSSTLSGTVAVGAPITDGRLRIIDSTGAVVASDIAIDADGHYAAITLTGTAPYRLEACGYAGANYQCGYSVASAAAVAGGTANVTPLTTATVLLATGQSPEALMIGAAPTLTEASIGSAQDQLRTGLASVLASAGVSASIDFVSAALTAGSRSGYDGVLDAIGVSLGQDSNAFVQITPRLGTGNLYLEQGQSSGTVTSSTSASSLSLSGLETLFQNLNTALASASACTAEATGIRRSIATSAQLAMGNNTAAGSSQVAEALCGLFASGDDGNSPMWGSRLLSPTLGHCDLAGSAPVCAISFVIQGLDGGVQPVGTGLGVTQEAGVWKFMGDLLPIQIEANARAQRTVRVDTATPIVGYDRALAFEIGAVPGLACAKISQPLADGSQATVGFYKRHPGASGQERLSLWSSNGFGASLDPLVGGTRSADDTWIILPQGDAGDAVVRNFYRGGRTVTVSLYGDGDCSAPFMVAGKSSFDVDVSSVPPVWSAMPSLPWPELDAATAAALRGLAIDAGASASLAAGWTFPHGPLGLDGATTCGSRAECGDGGTGRIGERAVRPGATSALVDLHNTGPAIAADADKTFSLYGRNGEGIGMQSNFSSCPASPAGEGCH